jgi:hypothetical protein
VIIYIEVGFFAYFLRFILGSSFAVSGDMERENTLRNDLKEAGINNPHLIKFTYTKIEFEKKLNDGIECHQALRELSQELNHSRESMSLFIFLKVKNYFYR